MSQSDFQKSQSQKILSCFNNENDIEKGKKAALGARSTYSGIVYVKTLEGWKPERTHGHLFPLVTPIDPTKIVVEMPVGFGKTKSAGESVSKKTAFAPKSLSDLKGAVSLGGSSDAKLMVHKGNGSQWVVKEARNKGGVLANGQLEQEMLADQLYKIAGFSSPESSLIKDGDKVYKIAPFIADCKQLGTVSYDKKQEIYDKVKKGFVMDALLGNWDVIGAGKDNILVSGKDSEIIRVDNGGSMLYRAKGSKKDSSDFDPEIKELKTLLDSSKNPSTAEVFKGITAAEIKKQAQAINAVKVSLSLAAMEFEKKYPEHKGLSAKISARLLWLEENIVNQPLVSTAEGRADEYDKSKYSSLATAKYFEYWDSFEMEGNPNIKEGIKKNILQVEKNNESTYEQYARKKGISVEEYKILLQRHVEDLMKESDYFRATDINILDKILTDHGRFKSQFETGTSHGSLSPRSRANAEETYFGFKNDESYDKENRPIYGYCSSNANGVNNSEGKIPPASNASHYGQVTVKIKKDIALKKATVTFEDSLGRTSYLASTPAAKPHFTSLSLDYRDPLEVKNTCERSSYTEIQYHNKLTFNDIESVHMSIHSSSFSSESKSHIDNINKMIDIGRKTNVPIIIFGSK